MRGCIVKSREEQKASESSGYRKISNFFSPNKKQGDLNKSNKVKIKPDNEGDISNTLQSDLVEQEDRSDIKAKLFQR